MSSISGPVAGAAVAAFYGYMALRRVVLRPRPVVPGPSTPDLRDEPPAVVNLLTHRLRAPGAASATLLDLAARRTLELSEVAPGQPLVRIRGPLAAGAPAYEARVLTRVQRVAGATTVPVASVSERYADGGHRWYQRLTREVAHDARRLGLTRGPNDGVVYAGLAAALTVVVALFGRLAGDLLGPSDAGPGALGVVIVGGGLLTLLAWLLLILPVAVLVRDSDRLTPLGEQVTAHWLGVAAWLRAHEPLRDLPPAAVAVWDRYLAYGVALGVMPHAAKALDLETAGHRDIVWSDHSGTARPVQVRYHPRNRLLRPLGQVAARARLVWAIFSLVVWAGLGLVAALASWTVPWRVGVGALAVLQVARAGYRLIRSSVDVARPARITGTLIDVSVAGETPVPDGRPGLPAALPTHYFLVVDDGRRDVLRPWIVNRDVARGGPPPPAPLRAEDWPGFARRLTALGVAPGDTVRLTGERWSRYVHSLERVEAPLPRLL